MKSTIPSFVIDKRNCPGKLRRGFKWGTIPSVDSEFSRGDELISVSLFARSMFWFLIFVVGSMWYLWRPWSLEMWGRYWFINSILPPLLVGIMTSGWLAWGSVRDLRRLFRDLRTCKRNTLHDGMVVDHHNLDEAANSTRNTHAPTDSPAVDARRP